MKKVMDKYQFYVKRLYTFWLSLRFKHCGRGCLFVGFNRLIGSKFIEIADNTKIGKHATLTAWGNVGGESFSPKVTIGSNCNIGEYCHITCINEIAIGDGVLTGRWVTITDNSHGKTTYQDLQIPPLKRKIFSKGAVNIGKNVWIGDKATILPNVTIGEGAIVAANTVVIENVPSYCVVAGNPGRIIKRLVDDE